MTIPASDRCRLPRSFWRSVESLGLHPSAVLRQAGLPSTLHLNETAVIRVSQLFAVWTAIETLSNDPGFGLKMVGETSTASHMLAFVAASYAADYRDGLARMARFKRLCSPDRLRFEATDATLVVTSEWPSGVGPEPHLSIEASFALLLEIGRRGTNQRLAPVRVALRRPDPGTDVHATYFGCTVRFGAPEDRMDLDAADLDRPFPCHNPELLEMLTPALAEAAKEIEAEAGVGEQVRAVLKRGMASGRPDVSAVARDLGLSERTLQRRIASEGTTFRTLLVQARRELGSQLLSDPTIEIDEIAFVLGYQDVNAFYRAFRQWEETTPGQWRRLHVDQGIGTLA